MPAGDLERAREDATATASEVGGLGIRASIFTWSRNILLRDASFPDLAHPGPYADSL